MKKIIIRKEAIKGDFVDIFKDEIVSEKEALLEFYEESEKDIEHLNNAYKEIVSKQINNEYFEIVYEIDELYALKITEDGHIYLCKRDSSNVSKLISWEYIVGKMFLGNAWWSSDEEIYQDIKTISLVEFLHKYKGF